MHRHSLAVHNNVSSNSISRSTLMNLQRQWKTLRAAAVKSLKRARVFTFIKYTVIYNVSGHLSKCPHECFTLNMVQLKAHFRAELLSNSHLTALMLSTLGWLFTLMCVCENGKVSDRDIFPLPCPASLGQSLMCRMNSGAVNLRRSLFPNPESPEERGLILSGSSSSRLNRSLLCLVVLGTLPHFCTSFLISKLSVVFVL